MNRLRKTKTYLVGPMEYVEDGSSWREEAVEKLTQMGVVCFDPYNRPFEIGVSEDKETHKLLQQMKKERNFDAIHEHMREIVATDLAMVDRADFIIGYINHSVPTFGTMHEIVVANQAKKPIFLFIEGGVENTPLWLLGLLPHRYFYDSFDELLTTIQGIDSGAIEIDSKRWRIFKEEFR